MWELWPPSLSLGFSFSLSGREQKYKFRRCSRCDCFRLKTAAVERESEGKREGRTSAVQISNELSLCCVQRATVTNAWKCVCMCVSVCVSVCDTCVCVRVCAFE